LGQEFIGRGFLIGNTIDYYYGHLALELFFFVRYDVIKTQIFVAIAHRTFQVTSVDKCKPSITGRHPSDHRPRYSSFINLVNLSLSRLQTETSSLPRPRDIVTLCAHATRHRNPYHVTCHRISYSHLSLKGLIALHSRFH